MSNPKPERWYENENSALEVFQKKGIITGIEFDKELSDLL